MTTTPAVRHHGADRLDAEAVVPADAANAALRGQELAARLPRAQAGCGSRTAAPRSSLPISGLQAPGAGPSGAGRRPRRWLPLLDFGRYLVLPDAEARADDRPDVSRRPHPAAAPSAAIATSAHSATMRARRTALIQP